MVVIKAVVFDCFGVLVSDSLAHIVSDFGVSLEDIEEIVGLVVAANNGSIKPDDYRKAIADKLGVSTEEYIERVKQEEQINTQLLDYIKILRTRYKTAILSNVSSLESLASRFGDGQLEQCFDLVIASGQIGHAKPEAQAYAITASKLGLMLSECVLIDDRIDYCDAAIGVGMQAIEYHNFEQMKRDLNKILSGS